MQTKVLLKAYAQTAQKQSRPMSEDFTLAGLTDEILKYNEADRLTLLSNLERHSSSTYTNHLNLLEGLHSVFQLLLAADISNDQKTALVIKLMDSIDVCTTGFHVRVNSILIGFLSGPTSLGELLALIRTGIVDVTAIQAVRGMHDSGNQVHVYNHFFTRAEQKYGVLAKLRSDPYAVDLHIPRIDRGLQSAFACQYTIFGMLIELESQIKSALVITGYSGKRTFADGYTRHEYDQFTDFFRRILDMPELHASELMLLDLDSSGVFDINWAVVKQLLYTTLKEKEYIQVSAPNNELFNILFNQDLSTLEVTQGLEQLTYDASDLFNSIFALAQCIDCFPWLDLEKQQRLIVFVLRVQPSLSAREYVDLDKYREIFHLFPITYDEAFFSTYCQHGYLPLTTASRVNVKQLVFYLAQLSKLDNSIWGSILSASINSSTLADLLSPVQNIDGDCDLLGSLRKICMLNKLGFNLNGLSTQNHLQNHYSKSDVIAALSVMGVNLKARDRFGQTLVHLAAESSNPLAIELIGALDLNLLNVGDNIGITPLHVAARNLRDKGPLLALCRFGVDLNPISTPIGNTPSQTPVQMALEEDIRQSLVILEIYTKSSADDQSARDQLHVECLRLYDIIQENVTCLSDIEFSVFMGSLKTYIQDRCKDTQIISSTKLLDFKDQLNAAYLNGDYNHVKRDDFLLADQMIPYTSAHFKELHNLLVLKRSQLEFLQANQRSCVNEYHWINYIRSTTIVDCNKALVFILESNLTRPDFHRWQMTRIFNSPPASFFRGSKQDKFNQELASRLKYTATEDGLFPSVVLSP